MPGNLGLCTVKVGGVEKSIYIEATTGRHSDGSVRSVLVQLEHSLTQGVPVTNAELFTDVTRQTVDRAKVAHTSIWGFTFPAGQDQIDNPDRVGNADATILPREHAYLRTCQLVPSVFDAAAAASAGGLTQDYYEWVFNLWEPRYWNHVEAMVPVNYSPASNFPGKLFSEGINFYDRAKNYFELYVATGDTRYAQRGCTIWALNATRWLRTTGGGDWNHQQFRVEPQGGAIYYLLTGDVENGREALVAWGSDWAHPNGGAVKNHGKDGTTGAIGQTRGFSKSILAAIWCIRLGITTHDFPTILRDLLNRGIADGVYNTANRAFNRTTGPGTFLFYKCSAVGGIRVDAVENYQNMMYIDALINYYEMFEADARIPGIVKGAMDWQFDSQWITAVTPPEVPGMLYTNAFFAAAYPCTNPDSGTATPRRDILGFYAGHFYWLEQQGFAGYALKGDAIIPSILSTPNNGTSGPAVNNTVPSTTTGHAQKVFNESTFGFSRMMRDR